MTNQSNSGLSDAHRAEARKIILKGIDMLLAHRDAVHYTQGPLRWEGINKRFRIASGDWITHGDCSSTHTWLIWNGVTHVHPTIRDIVNGEAWRAGFTGTIAAHGKHVRHLENAKVGDAVLYGPAPTYEHVATYIGGGYVFSHGGEAGPWKLPIDYRRDRGVIMRHI